MSPSILVITFLLAAIAGGGPDRLAATAGTFQVGEPQPQITLWAGDGRTFRRGDRVGVYFQSDVDAYVTVFRVDTDRRIRILFPWHPWNDNFVAGGREYEVFDGSGDSGPYAFTVDEPPGEGYLFAIASRVPFDYRHYISDEQWDYDLIGYRGRLMGDAEVASRELTDRVVPLGSSSFGVDLVSYTVAGKYAAYPLWDPYLDWCATMRAEIYDVPPIFAVLGPLGTPTVYTGPLNPVSHPQANRQAARAAVARAVSGQQSGTGVARRGTSSTAQRIAGVRSGHRVRSAGQSPRRTTVGKGRRTPSVIRRSPDRRTIAARPAARSPRARSQPSRRRVSQKSQSPRPRP